jgi:hypothetical protein
MIDIADRRLKVVGYWLDDASCDRWIHPQFLIQKNWIQDAKRKKIVKYLRSGHYLFSYMCSEECLLPGNSKDLGSFVFTDGEWLWRESLATYVEDFSLIIPSEFLEHMEKSDFIVPSIKKSKDGLKMDFNFWDNWCEYMKSNISKLQT